MGLLWVVITILHPSEAFYTSTNPLPTEELCQALDSLIEGVEMNKTHREKMKACFQAGRYRL